MFYDDGEYFNGTRVPLIGTLSGWVLRSQKQLFLPDLRKEGPRDGAVDYVIGKQKTSLSWVGVPLTAERVRGVITLGAYAPNALDQADMELLSNLAQHVSLALDNTIRHAQVEDRDQRMVSIPTVSQGIALFPDAANDIYRLIDLADRILYIAIERGRDQIEPAERYWQQTQPG